MLCSKICNTITFVVYTVDKTGTPAKQMLNNIPNLGFSSFNPTENSHHTAKQDGHFASCFLLKYSHNTHKVLNLVTFLAAVQGFVP